MRICVAGGQSKADFLIDFFLRKGHQVVVINDDEAYSEYLAKRHDILVYVNDPTKKFVLEEAEIDDFDILIGLRPVDADNLKICQIAKKNLHIKKTVAIVSNPKNVEVFRKLGVDTVISATYMVSRYIEQASIFDSITTTLSLENDRIVILNLIVEADSPLVGKTLIQINMPELMTIGCILREDALIIPKGSTQIKLSDKLLIITSQNKQSDAISFVTGK